MTVPPYTTFESDKVGVTSGAPKRGDAAPRAGEAKPANDNPDETAARQEVSGQTRDPQALELTFDGALAAAQSEVERTFVEDLRDLARERVPVPWGRYGPCFASVINLIGMDPAEAHAHPQLHWLLSRLGQHLHRAPARWGFKAPPPNAASSTFIAVVRAKLDELPFGTRIPRRGKLVSRAGMAELLGLPRNKLAHNIQFGNELAARLADGRLRLGRTWVDKGPSPDMLVQPRARLLAVIEGHVADDRPIPLRGLMRRTTDIDRLFDLAEVTDPEIRDALSRDPRIKKAITATMKVVGARHPADETRDGVTFKELLSQGEKATIERYRTTHPSAEPGGAGETEYVRNEMRPIWRLIDRNGLTAASDAEAALLGPDAARFVSVGAEGLTGGLRFYGKSMERWRSLLAAMSDLARSKLSFGQRLSAAIDRKGLSVSEFARRCEVPYTTLLCWTREQLLPSHLQLHYVHRIEDELGYHRDLLVDSLGILRTGKNTSGRKEITLSCGRTVPLKRYLRFLPAGALDWSEERLLLAVEKAERTHYGAQTLNTVRQKEVAALVRDRSPMDHSAPIFSEWKRLLKFKTVLNDPLRVQSARWEWRSKATIKNAKAHVEDFARWAMTPQSEGGLGLKPFQVSFILLLNSAIVNKYVIDRTKRFSHLTLDGREIGPILGGTEFGFLSFVKSILDIECGWLVQSPHELASPFLIDVKFRVGSMVSVDGFLTIEEDEDSPEFTVMDEALIAKIALDWPQAVLSARRQVASLTGKVARHYKMIRDPHALVKPILESESPIATVVRMVVEALKRAPSLERARHQHAREHRNAVIMLLLMTAVFRSGTLRNLTYRADGTGNLVRIPEGWDLRVEANLFKNGFCEWLFGPTWRRRDYERALGDWGSLTKIMDYYINVCRPILLNGRESDLLFPTGQSADEWSHKTFNVVITNWTRTWCVPNDRFGTGLEGVLPWGPHASRDIVATHIVRHYPGEGRWELASAILGTGVEVVKKRYAWVNAKRELAKADPMMKEAFDQAFGDGPLW